MLKLWQQQGQQKGAGKVRKLNGIYLSVSLYFSLFLCASTTGRFSTYSTYCISVFFPSVLTHFSERVGKTTLSSMLSVTISLYRIRSTVSYTLCLSLSLFFLLFSLLHLSLSSCLSISSTLSLSLSLYLLLLQERLSFYPPILLSNSFSVSLLLFYLSRFLPLPLHLPLLHTL